MFKMRSRVNITMVIVQTSSRHHTLMTLSVADSFPHQEVPDSLCVNADETAMGASKWHAHLDRKRLLHMQA